MPQCRRVSGFSLRRVSGYGWADQTFSRSGQAGHNTRYDPRSNSLENWARLASSHLYLQSAFAGSPSFHYSVSPSPRKAHRLSYLQGKSRHHHYPTSSLSRSTSIFAHLFWATMPRSFGLTWEAQNLVSMLPCVCSWKSIIERADVSRAFPLHSTGGSESLTLHFGSHKGTCRKRSQCSYSVQLQFSLSACQFHAGQHEL